MARVNVGGMQGFGPVKQELDEPAFHSDWEAHVFAMNRAPALPDEVEITAWDASAESR